MANKCKIPRVNSNSSPTGEELQHFAIAKIIPSFMAIYNNNDYKTNGVISPSKSRLAVIDFIKSLGSDYYSSEYSYLEEAFKWCLDQPAFKFFEKIAPKQSFQHIIKAKGTAEQISSLVFTDRIEDDETSDYDAEDYFLNNAYGTAVLAKKQTLLRMNNVVLNSFIIDREKGIIVSDIQQALHNVEVHKKQLFKDIYDYFTAAGKPLPISAEDLMTKSVSELINLCKEAIHKELSVGLFSGSDLQSLYEDGYNSPESDKQRNAKLTLTAYGSWLALNHFDNFIKMTVGDTIIINPSSKLRYSYSSKGTNINTTWRKDDNIDLGAEINKLTQALINTSPMYLFGSGEPINGAYMKFNDFSYITAKIKDLVYHLTASNIIYNEKTNRDLFNALTKEELRLVKNKSLRLVISHSRYNPQKYIPIIFKLLLTPTTNNIKTAHINKFGNFNDQDKNLVWTMYKNLYDLLYNENDNMHSLYSIQKNNLDSRNYYGAVSSVADCIFSVDFVVYTFDEGVLKLKTLRDAAIDKTRMEIIRTINTKNSSQLLGAYDFKKYDVSEITAENQLKGITIKLGTKDRPLYLHVTNLGESVTFSRNINPDAQAIRQEDIHELFDDQSVKHFIDDVLGLNLSTNAEFRKAYQELTKQDSDNKSPYVLLVLGLASGVFFYRYFAQTHLDGLSTRKDKIRTIKEFFVDEKGRPTFNNDFFNMNMIPSNRQKVISDLAQALGTTRGVNSSRLVKDSDNAMLSSQTLSRLLGNLIQQLDVLIDSYNTIKKLRTEIAKLEKQLSKEVVPNSKTRIKNQIKALNDQILDIKVNSYVLDNGQDPAASSFSLITNPDLFKGMLKSEEIKGLFGNKKQVKFTTAEAVLSSFLHNFVLGHCDKSLLEDNSPLGGGIVGLLPSVNSDKTTVGVAKFNLNAKVREGSDVTYMKLTNPELIKQIQTEIGTFYTKMYDNVKRDFELVSTWIAKDKDIAALYPVVINPDNNFKELNDWVDALIAEGKNITAEKVLFDITNSYNAKHPQNPIRLIDQVHYVTIDNHIQVNNTLKALKTRFSSDEETQNFFNLKSTEVLKSALDSNFVVNLYGNSNLSKQPEVVYLREHYKEWINDSGQMILAKINYKGTLYEVSNKSDLNALEKAMTLDKMREAGVDNPIAKYNENPYQAKKDYGVDNLINKIHMLKDHIELHPMLEKYNLMDYLFTQQLMCSTVGSHVAHPSKAKLKTPIIWKNPSTQYIQKNPDKFIEVSDAIDSLSDQELLDAWEKLKTQANNENKILITSSTRLKQLAGADFNYSIESSKDLHTIDSALDLLLDNEMAEEASRFYALHKRNVSFTAAMDLFQLNQIDGIPTWYNISIIDDIKEGLFTVDGNTDKAKPYDGATYVNPIIMYLENNSLNEARAGIDKKQFVHFYDELTGTGGIIKTAGFALTNDRIRNAIFYRDMMKNMTDHVWKDYLGNDYIADITTNYKGESVNYGEFYYKEGNKYYRASIKKADGPNAYIKTVTEVNKYGEDVGESIDILQENINTNYKLWQMFGGMHSLVMNGGMLEPSETSLQLVTKAVINTGKVKPSGYNEDGTLLNDITAQHIDLPLKNADIHYMPTIGAVKQGAANINPKSFYKGEHDLNFFRIRMTNAGIQLDKEHHADDSKLSLMTQVISAACSMGYTPKQATRLYKALYQLTMTGIKEFKDGFKEILNSKDPSKFETAIADCMIKNMITSTALDGDMLRAIAHDLIEKARKGLELTFTDTKSIPYSDPAVFEKLVTNLSVMMTKSGIKAKMNGILSVLCPTHGIVKMYNFVDPETKQRHNFTLSQLEEFYGKDYNQIIDWLLEKQEWHTEIKLTDIEIGNKYRIELTNGTYVVMNVKYPHDIRISEGDGEEIIGYKAFKNLIRSGAVKRILEYIKDGKELGSINYKFKGTDGFDYQIWDIDYIQDLFRLVSLEKKMKTDQDKLNAYLELINKYDNGLDNFNLAVRNHFLSYVNGGNTSPKHMLKLAKKYTKALQLDILFALSKGNTDKNPIITIDNKPVQIDKESIQVQPYEIVMPKIFLTEFGLDQFSNLDEIIQNKDYFYDRMVNNFDTKVLDEQLYDIELKRVNGDHIYIKDLAGALATWNLDLEKVTIHKKVDELGKVWRIDLATNKKMYELFSDSDEVYRIPGTNVEIIATSSKQIVTLKNRGGKKETTVKHGITFYLDNFKYQSLHISEAIAAGKNATFSPTQRPLFENVMDMISHSKNKCAKYWTLLFNTYNRELQILLNQELNNFDELGERLKMHLKELALIMHTSLLKSLDIIAARIPALNQQSFMPMKVVAWENPNINTAYVSVMQFFLQGSDLDIDAVSLLTHSFGKNGNFHEWSPDFDMRNIDFLNESMKLPFPSGKELRIVSYERSGVHEADKQPLFINNPYYQAFIQIEQEKLAIASRTAVTPEDKNLQLADYELAEKQSLKAYVRLLEYVEDSNGIIYFDKNADSLTEEMQNIINRINAHNTYLVGVSDDVSVGAIKNYLVGQLYEISTDAANLLEAHTGVDVATGPLKKIANASELSEVQKTYTPGNVFNKFQAIEEASVGKDDIAICATGLKGFFAATLHCNRYLNTHLQNKDIWKLGEADALAELITFTPVTIGGRTFKSLANIRVDDLSKVDVNSEIYKELKDKGFDDDASVIMSALLSLSTDNAKELCLAKINAGTSMIGMYLYGAAIGMDFEVLNKIIASPLGFTIAKLLNSNEFTLTKGKTSVDAALSYLYDGPGKNDVSKYNVPISGLLDETTFTLFNKALLHVINENNHKEVIKAIGDSEINAENIGKMLPKLIRAVGAIPVLNFLYSVNQRCNNVLKAVEKTADDVTAVKNASAISNQYYNFLTDFVDSARTAISTKYDTEYGESNIADDLNKLALGADEFKRLGQFLRLNQEIKTKSSELIDFVQKIESCITERVSLMKKVKQRLGEKYEADDVENFDFLEFAKSFISDPDNPEAYHNKQIELYEQYCKTCINPLRVLTSVDHYKGYLEALIMAYNGDFMKSVKFRAIKTIGNSFINNFKISSKLDKTYVMKGVLRLVDDYINNAYLNSRPLFPLPKSTKGRQIKIVDQYGELKDVKEGTEIALGTKEGNATFEYFFEKIFIPALKQSYGNNEFVKNLSEVLVSDPISGSKFIAISLPINMMPTSDSERALLNSFKNDFTRINGVMLKIGNQEYSVVKMFHYYNLLKFNGKSGRSSLLHIFEDIMTKNDDLKSYRLFVNEFDATYDFTLNDIENPKNEEGRTLIQLDEQVVIDYLAPLSNPFSGTSKIIKYKDNSIGQTVLLRMIEEEKQANFTPEEMELYGEYLDELDQEEYTNADPETFMGFEEYDLYESDTPNYGKYERIDEGGLKRFDPKIIKIFNPREAILSKFLINDGVVENVLITGGKLSSFIYNGKEYKVDSKKSLIKIVVDNGLKHELLDEATLRNMINQKLNCG